MLVVRRLVLCSALVALTPSASSGAPAAVAPESSAESQEPARVFEVPEPAALALFGLGLHAVARSRRRRREAAAARQHAGPTA